jgi:hypothetical protein
MNNLKNENEKNQIENELINNENKLNLEKLKKQEILITDLKKLIEGNYQHLSKRK